MVGRNESPCTHASLPAAVGCVGKAWPQWHSLLLFRRNTKQLITGSQSQSRCPQTKSKPFLDAGGGEATYPVYAGCSRSMWKKGREYHLHCVWSEAYGTQTGIESGGKNSGVSVFISKWEGTELELESAWLSTHPTPPHFTPLLCSELLRLGRLSRLPFQLLAENICYSVLKVN